MGKLVLMHKEDMVKKYGAKLNFDIDNSDYDGEDWEVFLDELRGLTYVDSRRSGYMVQEID